MAYSDKIKLPAYKRLRIWLSVIILLKFLLPTGLIFFALLYSKYCPLIGTLFFTGLFIWWWGRKIQIINFFESDWEGIVVEKTAVIDTKVKWSITPNNSASADFLGAFNCMLVVQRSDNGKLYRTRYLEYIMDGYNTHVKYFRHGETVRHHRCLPLYEKFDKSKERKLLCFKCGRFADKYEEKCWHCGLPVLSEETEYVKKTHTLAESEKCMDRIW